MKNLDLEKMIIVLCLLGLPVAGGWIYNLQSELAEADVALRTCKPTIAKIHAMHTLITKTKREMDASDFARPDVFFPKRAMASQKGEPQIKQENIKITTVGQRKVHRGGNGPEIGTDIEVKVEFTDDKGRPGRALSRSFINAFIVNCESLTPIWRLRNLKITNVAFKRQRKTQAPEQLELPDEWVVDELLFARRAPVASTDKN